LYVPFTACGLGVDRTSCGKAPSHNARLDFVMTSSTAVVVIEVDEAQHASYCVGGEIARVNDVFESLRLRKNKKHVHFIRFNPDKFKINGRKGQVSIEKRHARLMNVIKEALESNKPQETLSIQHMYYDTWNGQECIMDQIHEHIQEICLPPIIH
jgi:hypothetical protein